MAALWAKFSGPDVSRDRRGAARRTLRLVTRTAGTDTAGDVLILDLSTTGMMIETAEALAIDDIIEVELPEAGPLAARVLWRREAFAGCEFLSRAPVGAVSAALLRAAPQPHRQPMARVTDADRPAPARIESEPRLVDQGLMLVFLGLLLTAVVIFLLTLMTLPFSANQFGP